MPKTLTPNITNIYHLNNLKAGHVVQYTGTACDFNGNPELVSILQQSNDGKSNIVYTLMDATNYETDLDFADAYDNYSLAYELSGHAQSMSPFVSGTNIITMNPHGSSHWPTTIGIMSDLYMTLPDHFDKNDLTKIVRYKNLFKLATIDANSIERFEFGMDASSMAYSCLVFKSNTAYSFVVVTYDDENENEKGLISSLEATADEIEERKANDDDTDKITDSDYEVDATKLHVVNKVTVPIKNLNMLTEIIANQHDYNVSSDKNYSRFSLQGVSMDNNGTIYLSSGFSPVASTTQQYPMFIVKMPNFAKSSPDNWSLIDLTTNAELQKINYFIEPESIQMYDTDKALLSIAYHDRTDNMKTKANSLVRLEF